MRIVCQVCGAPAKWVFQLQAGGAPMQGACRYHLPGLLCTVDAPYLVTRTDGAVVAPRAAGDDLDRHARKAHAAFQYAMARQGWIVGQRLNQDFKTHPWLVAYNSLNDAAKSVWRTVAEALDGR